jgi:lysophospholipase L1-like esterase
MKTTLLSILLLIFTSTKSGTFMQPKVYSYLALGDSYTIGESVPVYENFPTQVSQLLRKTGHKIHAPEILAKTGWTTGELISAINQHRFLNKYDFVSLLIGVNNQYRGRSVEEYKKEFEELLKLAIAFAGNDPSKVVVLSIPDWGVTPFAEGRDRSQIAKDIDVYNSANKEITVQNNVHYIDITPLTREAITDQSLLAPDGLHPSAKDYQRWAERVALFFKSKI